MRNLKLTIEYDGTNYHGWQIQPNYTTIQEVLQASLAKITKTPVQLIGAGRTDSGVHAAGQVANFQTDSQMTPISFLKALNTILPRDIVIVDVEEVAEDFHARFSALQRVYRYTILNRHYPSAFLRHTACFYPRPIHLEHVNELGQVLIGKRDFSSFQRTGSERTNPVCEIYTVQCWRSDDLVFLEVEADSFLRGMVRAIVGTILKLQGRKGSICRMKDITEQCNRSSAGASAPAHGLSLISVKY